MKRIIALQIKDDYIFDSEGAKQEIKTPEDLFDFLLINYGEGTFKVFWNLYILVNTVGKLLPESAFQELTNKDKVFYGDYKLFSSAGKLFGVTYNKNTHDNFYDHSEANIYHLSQFFPDQKADTLEEIKSKGEQLLTALDELNFNPTKLSSAISIYDENVLQNKYIPTIFDLGDEGLDFCDFAYQMMNREWRSIYKMGHFEQAYQYDKRSGYPSIIRNFRDTNEAKFWIAKTLQKCDFGIVKGEINITSDYSPIVSLTGENKKGRYIDYFTLPQIGFMYHYNLGTFKIEEGRYMNFLSNHKPFDKIMVELYKMREKGGVLKDFAKSVSVGLGGRFAQEHEDKYGNYFSPIYSVMTTSQMSIEVGKFIMENHLEANLIDVVVDGLLADKLVPVQDNKQMGDWRVDEVKALILSLGCRYLSDKKDAYGNTYENMIASIKEHPFKKVYNQVLINKNILQTNRHFKEYPSNGNDLLNTVYESTAIETK